MKLEFYIVSSEETAEIFDVSTISTDIKLDTGLDGQTGTLTFLLQDVPDLLREKLTFGSLCDVRINGKGFFYGYIFTLKTDSTGVVEVTAFDQMRYLKNKDFYANTKNEKIQDVFSTICSRNGLKFAVNDSSDYVLPARIYNGQTAYKMLQGAIDDQLVGTGQYFVVRDEYGIIKLTELKKLLRENIVIGDTSLMSEYRHSKTIDKSYNRIKLLRENKESGSRETYIAEDTKKQAKWGVLQYYEKIDGLSEGQAKTKADNLLNLYNRVQNGLEIITVADDMYSEILLDLKAGNGFILRMKSNISAEEITQNAWIYRSEITIDDDVVYNRMQLMLESE